MPEWAMQCDIYVICSFVLRSSSEFEPNWAPCTIHNDIEIVAVCTACDECWSHSCFAFDRIHASQLIRLPETATAPRQRDPSSFHTNLCLRCAAMCRWMELGGKEAVYKYLSHRNAQKHTMRHILVLINSAFHRPEVFWCLLQHRKTWPAQFLLTATHTHGIGKRPARLARPMCPSYKMIEFSNTNKVTHFIQSALGSLWNWVHAFQSTEFALYRFTVDVVASVFLLLLLLLLCVCDFCQ